MTDDVEAEQRCVALSETRGRTPLVRTACMDLISAALEAEVEVRRGRSPASRPQVYQ